MGWTGEDWLVRKGVEGLGKSEREGVEKGWRRPDCQVRIRQEWVVKKGREGIAGEVRDGLGGQGSGSQGRQDQGGVVGEERGRDGVVGKDGAGAVSQP
jgi:hypothetical protein